MKVLSTINLFAALICASPLFGQCCGGGGGSPIAGGSSQGVLEKYQMEINTNFQLVNTNTFYKGDSKDSALYFDSFRTQYIYTRLAYGITKEFTMSVETGYWLNKTQVELHQSDTITSRGIGDLIIFPRYDVINRSSASKRVELTVGLGFKIPLGKYNDSLAWVEPFSGNTYYIIKPIGLQTSSGANDLIFYTFFYRGYPAQTTRLFVNATYIRRGWNPLGEKFGDFASIGLFAGKTFFDKLGVLLQVRGEWIDQMKLNETVLMYSYPSYDPLATGSKKVFLSPQLNYTFAKCFNVYAMADIPLYQYVTNNQSASELQYTVGISYRFYISKKAKECVTPTEGDVYQCPMKCEDKVFSEPGKCPVCGMDLEK